MALAVALETAKIRLGTIDRLRVLNRAVPPHLRAQINLARQNIYDGTWNKLPSQGWMFVPIDEYHGGWPECCIEPVGFRSSQWEWCVLALGERNFVGESTALRCASPRSCVPHWHDSGGAPRRRNDRGDGCGAGTLQCILALVSAPAIAVTAFTMMRTWARSTS